MFVGLTREICEAAWKVSRQTVLMAAREGITDDFAGTIVVCHPRRLEPDSEISFGLIFSDDVNDELSGRDFRTYAKAKAELSWKTGLSSRKVQQDAPHLYEGSSIKWGGSVIENGLIVAYSGVQPVFDEAIAATMLRWTIALCQHEMTREGGVMNMPTSRVGDIPVLIRWP
jgi:hypothetical protein